MVSNNLETFKISEMLLIIEIATLHDFFRLDASNQGRGVRLLKCTTRGEKEGEGERNSKKTTVLIVAVGKDASHNVHSSASIS